MNQDMMTIAEMCAAYGVTPRTLRYYESRELLAPERRGGQRLFGKRDRARLTLILRGKRFGFALEDMRQLLDLYDHDGNSVEQIARSCELARARLTEMEAQRAELDQAIAELKEQLTWGADMLAAQRRPAAE
ncbi:MAG: MerR family DNA-binding transcriptional regulator [Rhodobacterales bacterium]|nr:MerR family DNA-binding transcriptional regulator [Rhodobacterales bacterium]